MAEQHIEDGGPAFPIPESRDPTTGQGIYECWGGMSLRDWFAGQALGTLLETCRGDNRGVGFTDHVASCAYAVADAMLKARSSSPSQEGRDNDAEVRHDL